MKKFPVLWQPSDMRCKRPDRCPKSIPWELIEPHEQQALKNHDQTLDRLAQRGGLSPQEMIAVLSDKHWRETWEIIDDLAIDLLLRFMTTSEPDEEVE